MAVRRKPLVVLSERKETEILSILVGAFAGFIASALTGYTTAAIGTAIGGVAGLVVSGILDTKK